MKKGKAKHKKKPQSPEHYITEDLLDAVERIERKYKCQVVFNIEKIKV